MFAANEEGWTLRQAGGSGGGGGRAVFTNWLPKQTTCHVRKMNGGGERERESEKASESESVTKREYSWQWSAGSACFSIN